MLVHVISVAAFVNRPFVARAALDAGLARMETQVRRHGTIPLAVTQPTAEGIWNYQIHTMNAFAMLALQSQFLTDTAMLQSAAAAAANAAAGSVVPSQTARASQKQSKAAARPGASPADIAAAAAANAAAAAIAAVAGLNPNSAMYLALPDVLQYNFDGSVAKSDSLFGTLANLLHDSQLQLRLWTDGASASKGARNDVPFQGRQLAAVLWRVASVWESAWYPYKSFRAPVNCRNHTQHMRMQIDAG